MHLYSESCERNKEPIFKVISEVISSALQSKIKTLLEVGSGTGQHAVYMAEKWPHIDWQMSDFGHSLQEIKRHFDPSGLTNILPAIELDVRELPWSQTPADLVYTSNSLHIMDWGAVKSFFKGAGQVLNEQGYLVVYGPFKYNGQFTSPSNANFDLWLKDRNSLSGVREFEKVNQLAQQAGLKLVCDKLMPANNQCLFWQRE